MAGVKAGCVHLCRVTGNTVWSHMASDKKGPKGKGRYSSSWEPHLRATGRHLPYGITQCYLPPDTSERAPPNPSHAGWYSIYLPQRDGRLSWPSWLDSAPAGNQTRDLSITSPTQNCCTNLLLDSFLLGLEPTTSESLVWNVSVDIAHCVLKQMRKSF